MLLFIFDYVNKFFQFKVLHQGVFGVVIVVEVVAEMSVQVINLVLAVEVLLNHRSKVAKKEVTLGEEAVSNAAVVIFCVIVSTKV